MKKTTLPVLLVTLFLWSGECFVISSQHSFSTKVRRNSSPIIQPQPYRPKSGQEHATVSTQLAVGTGFSFQGDEQILVSVQKPLGMVLEQEIGGGGSILVASLDATGSAARAGVLVGDCLVAVQNVDVTQLDLEDALGWIGRAPQVLNLRFVRSN